MNSIEYFLETLVYEWEWGLRNERKFCKESGCGDRIMFGEERQLLHKRAPPPPRCRIDLVWSTSLYPDSVHSAIAIASRGVSHVSVMVTMSGQWSKTRSSNFAYFLLLYEHQTLKGETNVLCQGVDGIVSIVVRLDKLRWETCFNWGRRLEKPKS